MNEQSQHVNELYAKFRANEQGSSAELPNRTHIFPGADRLARRLRRGRSDRVRHEERPGGDQLRFEITEALKDQPGRYPLQEIRFSSAPPFGHTGFSYGFEHTIGDDTFAVSFWSYNRWGIDVQKEAAGSTPEIEITESEDGIKRILHLPEGFRIPVGPLSFEEEGVPLSQGEQNATRDQVLRIAKGTGIKVNRKAMEVADRMMPPMMRYPDRYFYWEPDLFDEPTEISIDFDAIKPSQMGLSWEEAPTFKNTIVNSEED